MMLSLEPLWTVEGDHRSRDSIIDHSDAHDEASKIAPPRFLRIGEPVDHFFDVT
jgi:hypothetical protein